MLTPEAKAMAVRVVYADYVPCSYFVCPDCTLRKELCDKAPDQSRYMIKTQGLIGWVKANALQYIKEHPSEFSEENITELLL